MIPMGTFRRGQGQARVSNGNDEKSLSPRGREWGGTPGKGEIVGIWGCLAGLWGCPTRRDLLRGGRAIRTSWNPWGDSELTSKIC